jgi:DNA-binding protein HU-beta
LTKRHFGRRSRALGKAVDLQKPACYKAPEPAFLLGLALHKAALDAIHRRNDGQHAHDSSGVYAIHFLEGTFSMNKTELINAVADKADISKADAGRAVDAFFEVVGKALKKKDKVSLVGFGTFLVRERAARTGRNPKTGDTIKIKASKTPSFKAGKGLKDLIK